MCVLVDVSLSTDSYVDERRVLDVEKEALLALTHGLAACGDEHAIVTFTSHRRQRIDIRTVKDFEERLDARVVRRIQALKPGSYTRMGAAIRHATALLEKRPHTHRLLLVLTDGKPNDIDHYEGRYAIEDTRVAVQEARRAGLRLFGVTVDAQGRDYLPYIFGPGAYAIFPHVGTSAFSTARNISPANGVRETPRSHHAQNSCYNTAGLHRILRAGMVPGQPQARSPPARPNAAGSVTSA